MPEIVELFSSFSRFFSIEECYKAFISCGSDVAEAAAWLVDQGEQERGKKSLDKKRCVLLGESEIINNPAVLQPVLQEGSMPPSGAALRKPNELDIAVRENAVLHPLSINAGRWTVSAPPTCPQDKQYITYHSLTNDNSACIKVFSVSQDDVHVLNESGRQRDDEEAESSEEKKDEEGKKAEETTEIDVNAIREEDLYEPIKMKGTLVKTIQLQRSGPMADLTSHNTYLIYDHSY